MRQIGFSDMVILNKVDLVDGTALQKVRDWIDDRLLRVRIVESVQCDVPLEILLGVGRFEVQQLAIATNDPHGSHEVDHSQAFSTWSYETDQPLSLEALREMVRRKLHGNIYRCKGVVYAQEELDRRAILQVVGRRTDISLGEEWGESRPRTQIVAIAAAGRLDDDELTALFQGCVGKVLIDKPG